MCRIIFNPKNKKFNKDELQESLIQNPDGTGLYYYDNKLHAAKIIKGSAGTPFAQMGKTINALHNKKHLTNICLHFRFGTSGGKGEAQTHPISLNDNIYLVHNGILTDYEGKPESLSDTQCFAFGLNEFLTMRNISTLEQIRNNEFLQAYISHRTSNSKLILLQGGDALIINEHLGEGKGGLWKSWKAYEFKGYGYDGYDDEYYKDAGLKQLTISDYEPSKKENK